MTVFELVNDKDKCCGCGLCAVKCPKNAIEMREDEFGFVFPYINKDKCINCGLCKNVCSYNNRIKNNIEKETYVAQSKTEELLKTTSSGGVFTSIATEFINQNGVVYGCSLEKQNNKYEVKHIKVNNLDDLEKLKGSKYVQSNISNVYKEIKNDLKEQKTVLFSGTPCQVAAIKKYTNNPDNLFTIDIVCHGTPNNKMFNDFIDYENKRRKNCINNFKFRDKSMGWGYIYSYETENKIIRKTSYKSAFYQLFLDSKINRENCYSCPFANDNRVGDITIGDYWGVEIEHPELVNSYDFKKGVSCVIINSYKGKKLIENNNLLKLDKSKIEKIKKHNRQLNKPSTKPNDRDLIIEKYKNGGYSRINKYYWNHNFIKIIIKTLYYKIPKKVRNIIRGN